MATPSKATLNTGTIIVAGLAEIDRNLRLVGPTFQREFRAHLKEIAEPVRRDAEQLARTKISGIARSKTGAWAEMRTGVSGSFVYVAPKRRGVKTRGPDPRRRPNLVDLMMGRALNPALASNEALVKVGVEAVIDSVGKLFEAA